MVKHVRRSSFAAQKARIKRVFFKHRVSRSASRWPSGRRWKGKAIQMKEKQMLMEAAVDAGNIEKLNKVVWDQKSLRIENMVLGNARTLTDLKVYETYGISAVLTCAEELAHKPVPVKLAARCVLPCKDDTTFRLPFKKAIAFLKEQTAAGRTVFVHCWAGHNRAGAIIAAYFMEKWNKSAVYMARYLAQRRFGCLWNHSFCRQLIKWEARLNMIVLKNYAIEAVKIGTYYSENKEEVDAYVLDCFNDVRKSTDPQHQPNFEHNALTQKYSLCELLEAAHGEECNIFDPFDEAEDSEDSDGELLENPKKKVRIEVAETNGSRECATQKPKNADPAAKSMLQLQFEAFEDGIAIAPEKLPAFMEACASNEDIRAAVTLSGKVSWESVPSEVLDECFKSIKVLYNPESHADISRSLRRRLNQAVNELAKLRHARTPEGKELLESNKAIERLIAALDGAPNDTMTHGDVCSWIQEKLKVNSNVAALCVRKLVGKCALRKVKRRYVFPTPLKATSSTWSTDDVALAEKLVSKTREKRNARSKRNRKQRRKS